MKTVNYSFPNVYVDFALSSVTCQAEIRSPCPFRGSKNLDGCYRMMEYDRKLMEAIGADFVVLQSQAEENTEYCRVAITRESKSRKDLLPAHIRVQNMNGTNCSVK